MPVPAVAKVVTVFAIILAVNRMKVTLSVALLAGSGLLALWMGFGPVFFLRSTLKSLREIQTVGLILIVAIILVMSRLMKETGHMDRILGSFDVLSRDPRVAATVMPALIGLLPMPGGALFSAPMVDTALCDNPMSREEKTVVNYWFRHIWEYWWPLYPGVVLVVALLKVEPWQFMVMMIPMTAVSVTAGILFMLRPLGYSFRQRALNLSAHTIKSFLWEIAPIVVVVVVIVVLSAFMLFLKMCGVNIEIPGSLAILPGLFAALVWVCVVNRVKLRKVFLEATNKSLFPMISLVVAIMIFKGVMNDSSAVIQMRDEFVRYHIPVLFVIILMPFLSGLITGIAIGFVGTSFPLIIPMFQAHHTFLYLSWAGLAYTFGYMGMMLSPVHLCFLVTKDYFKADLIRSYRYLIPPIIMVMITVLFLFAAGNILVK